MESLQDKTLADNPPALMRNATMKLTIIARQLRAHFDQSVVRLGVTRSQWTVIAAVARYPGTTQRHIANLLEMAEASGRTADRPALRRRPAGTAAEG